MSELESNPRVNDLYYKWYNDYYSLSQDEIKELLGYFRELRQYYQNTPELKGHIEMEMTMAIRISDLESLIKK